MDTLKPGSSFILQHYSGIKLIKSSLAGIDGDIVNVRLDKDAATSNFKEGDPVVVGYESSNTIYTLGSYVHAVNYGMAEISLKKDGTEPGSEKREYERLPVSLCADIKCVVTRNRYDALVKDISYYGMLMFAKAEFELNQKIEVDVYADKVMLFLNANVVRKVSTPNGFQYGLGLFYNENGSLSYIKDYLKKLGEERVEAIRKLIESIKFS